MVDVMCCGIGGAVGDDVWREATSEEPTVPPSPPHITRHNKSKLDMQATLLGRLVFPPPAPRAELFAQTDGAGTRRAADAREELVMQRVVVHLVLGDVMPHVAPSPSGQGVELGLVFGGFFAGVEQRHLGAGGPQNPKTPNN